MVYVSRLVNEKGLTSDRVPGWFPHPSRSGSRANGDADHPLPGHFHHHHHHHHNHHHSLRHIIIIIIINNHHHHLGADQHFQHCDNKLSER